MTVGIWITQILYEKYDLYLYNIHNGCKQNSCFPLLTLFAHPDPRLISVHPVVWYMGVYVEVIAAMYVWVLNDPSQV